MVGARCGKARLRNFAYRPYFLQQARQPPNFVATLCMPFFSPLPRFDSLNHLWQTLSILLLTSCFIQGCCHARVRAFETAAGCFPLPWGHCTSVSCIAGRAVKAKETYPTVYICNPKHSGSHRKTNICICPIIQCMLKSLTFRAPKHDNCYVEGVAHLNLFATKQAQWHIYVTSGHSAPLVLTVVTLYVGYGKHKGTQIKRNLT